MSNQSNRGKSTYPWKGFLVFLGIYTVSIVTHYPVLLTQAQIYIEILGESFNHSASQLALTALIQPILLGIVAIYYGHRYATPVNLRSLTSEFVEKNEVIAEKKKVTLKDSIPFIVSTAVVVAILELSFDFVFQNGLSEMFQPQYAIPTVSQALSSILYSGLGQEILLRWGVMAAIIYVISSKGKSLNQWHYFIGVVFTALLYAFAQYNMVLGSVDFSFILLLRILLVSGLSGILFGWLYYAFHFEAAALSHMLANTLIVLGNILIVEMSAI